MKVILTFSVFVIFAGVAYLTYSAIKSLINVARINKMLKEMYCPSCVSSPCRCDEATQEFKEMESYLGVDL